MGCVFGREVSAAASESSQQRREKIEDVNGEFKKNKEEQDEEKQGNDNGDKGIRKRSSRYNPRLSNPPKNVHGEQVAAGWPSWLSAVAGEAINGWTPRRADSFEKLDKVVVFNFIWPYFVFLLQLILKGKQYCSHLCPEFSTNLFQSVLYETISW